MKIKITIAILFCAFIINAQENPNPLPKYLTKAEKKIMNSGLYQAPKTGVRGFTEPPSFPTRTMGEWEELEAIVITWDAFYATLKDIVKYAKDEVEVINVCDDSTSVKTYLSNNGIDFENLTFIEAPFNTVWVRDYGPNPVYQNDVDSLVFIDWIYNRPRPGDDLIPDIIAEYMGVPIYASTIAPNDLVHTGGNFMADGLGTGFSSRLILAENDNTNQFGTSNHSEEDIEDLLNDFMGIQDYPKMTVLPYDGINHIDMHMKLLDEQTLLIGDFPVGISDGPQLEENIQFVLDNYKTKWGTDYRIERIIQPPCENGNYPPNCQGGSFSYEYRTYTNALFVNKSILVPIYNTELDEEALARWRELMPGYKVHGIDCTQIINSGGAIHCITKEIGVKDPLWIAHRGLDFVSGDTNFNDYEVEATIKHRSGIASANLYWTTDIVAGYELIPMTIFDEDSGTWKANIPQQANGGHIYYYIEATSNSGKTIARPLPAPEGYFDFLVEPLSTSTTDLNNYGLSLGKIYPIPAQSNTTVEVFSDEAENIELSLINVLGQEVEVIFEGQTAKGTNQYHFLADKYPAGGYWVQLKSIKDGGTQVQKVIID